MPTLPSLYLATNVNIHFGPKRKNVAHLTKWHTGKAAHWQSGTLATWHTGNVVH